MLQYTTLYNFGAVGNNIAVDTLVCLINAPGPGRYKIWGHGRHSVADGLKLTSPFTLRFASNAADTVNFGPFIMEITNSSAGIIVGLAVATGASDTASATLYAERLA